MRIWILQTGEPLHCDHGSPRPMRAINLANALIKRGHNVVLWSTDFFHQEKRNRFGRYKEIRISNLLTIKLIPSPGYKKNFSFSRLWDHYILAKNLSSCLQLTSELPDIAFIGYPPIEVAFVMSNWLKKYDIPFVIDVKDQWPAIFLDLAPTVLKPILSIMLYPYFYLAKRTLKSATSISAMSRSFLIWVSKFSHRELNAFDMIFPLTVPLENSKLNQLGDAKKYLKKCGINLSHNRRVCFIGSLSPSFDFSMIKEVAIKFMNEKIDFQFIICGDGDDAFKVKQMMHGLNNVIFTGWIDKPVIDCLTRVSLASLAPYKNVNNFIDNIPNKIIDAISYGLPIITSLSGEVENIVRKKNIGFYVNSSKDLELAILTMLKDPFLTKKLSHNAKKLYIDEFSFNKVYNHAISQLEIIAQKK